ncbi:MAG: rhomboid family intramembrane serine protease [Capnocytophaga sp.]|nr:rhomboid family intramembrane serine protease [Capnocytophaga sp.]
MSKIPYIQKLNLAEQIILLNVFLFGVTYLLVYFGNISYYQINEWVGLPQGLEKFITKPWTILTYAFFHASFQHLFWNMLFLYFVGQIFFNLFNTKQFLRAYAFGIIFGGITFLLIEFLLPPLFDNSILLGASGAIMALLLFVCVIAPRYTVHLFFSIRLKLWMIALILIVFDIIQLTSPNSGGRIVHLAGAFAGYFIGVLTQQPLGYKKRNLEKLTQKNISKNFAKPSKSNNALSESQKIKQHKVNIILDKISSSGYASLSEEEKNFLFDASKDMNN